MSADETREEAELIRRGEDALDIVHQTFEHWMEAAVALDIGRRKALDETGANSIHDRFYAKAFGRWLDKHPKFKDRERCPGATRLWLLRCYQHQSEIMAWRKIQAVKTQGKETVKYNYPETVFKRWASHERPDLLLNPDEDDDVPKRSTAPQRTATESPTAKAVRLEEELAAARAKIQKYEHDQGNHLQAAETDSAEDLIAYFERAIPTRWKQIKKLVLEEQESAQPKRTVKRGVL